MLYIRPSPHDVYYAFISYMLTSSHRHPLALKISMIKTRNIVPSSWAVPGRSWKAGLLEGQRTFCGDGGRGGLRVQSLTRRELGVWSISRLAAFSQSGMASR